MAKTDKVSFNKMRSVFFFGLIIILAIAVIYIFLPFFYPIFWAAVLAIIFYPLYKFVHKHIKMPGFSSIISILLIIVILFLPLVVIGLLVINESIDLYHAVSQANFLDGVKNISNILETTPFAPYAETIRTEWTGYAANAAKTVSVLIFNNLKNITQNSLRFIFMLFIMFYTLYYFFKDGPRMLKKLMHLSPLGDKYENLLYEKFTSTTSATIKGTIIVGGVQGILGGIVFWLTGIEAALIWGIVMIALSIIPAIGSFLVWMPAGIIMIAVGNIWQGILILVFGAVIISTIDNLLRPYLVGNDTQMHPLVVLFSTLGGLIIFGISGFVIGPIIAALFLSIMSIYDYYYKNELEKN
ncbi:MAG: AI-2E family transporter [Candidatus Magasanikbacteria bacterium]|nr:AI-2E family transporter [Candidatus Magasanikbacteria bacterium]